MPGWADGVQSGARCILRRVEGSDFHARGPGSARKVGKTLNNGAASRLMTAPATLGNSVRTAVALAVRPYSTDRSNVYSYRPQTP
jgi:hypothetical protein